MAETPRTSLSSIAKGAFVREIGKGLYGFQMAHAVRVDPQDNIWVVDEGTDMVIKFTPDGRVAMTMGRRAEFGGGLKATPPPNTPPPPALAIRFGRPTDVAWDAAGNIFVSDGYTNSSVVKYDKNGRFIKAVGTKGSGPLQFNTPHSIQTDADGNVYVADRGKPRIQVLSNDLEPKAVYDNVGTPWAICITPGPHQYLYSSNSNPDNNNSLFNAVSGEIYKMELDGTVLGKFGKAGKQLKEFTTVHAMDCRNENEILASEITGWRVQKLTLRPQKTQNLSPGEVRVMRKAIERICREGSYEARSIFSFASSMLFSRAVPTCLPSRFLKFPTTPRPIF